MQGSGDEWPETCGTYKLTSCTLLLVSLSSDPGAVAHMVERSLSMREVRRSILRCSIGSTGIRLPHLLACGTVLLFHSSGSAAQASLLQSFWTRFQSCSALCLHLGSNDVPLAVSKMLRGACVCSCGTGTRSLSAIVSLPCCRRLRHGHNPLLISQAG